MKKISIKAVISFLTVLLSSLIIIIIVVIHKTNFEHYKMDKLITEKSAKINSFMSNLFYKTQTLSVLIRNDGKISNFKQIAATMVDDPVILNILIAPNGVVSNVYPYIGNENVIGMDLLNEGEGQKEAIMAVEIKQLVMGGPYELLQGRGGIVGRLPVWIDGESGEKEFWGLVSVTLKHPEFFNSIMESQEFVDQDYIYEIYGEDLDGNQREMIYDGGSDEKAKSKYYIEKEVSIFNARWFFRIYYKYEWYKSIDTWLMVIFGFAASLLMAYIIQKNIELNRLKSEFEKMANTDPLTGISNRRHFTELSEVITSKAKRDKSETFIISYDLDYFKKVNDNYGHMAGDEVLKETVRRIKGVLRPYDLFARNGGEEFIILISDVDKTEAINTAEIMRLKIAAAPVSYKDDKIPITSSFGIAFAEPYNDLDTAIDYADKALYKAKNDGRNRVVFYDYE